jgi:uroporphyrin-III C-methyltransferase
LIGAGLPADTPVALVENASLPGERQLRTRLDLLPLAAAAALGEGPAILLIGEAMRAAANAVPALGRSSVNASIARH